MKNSVNFAWKSFPGFHVFFLAHSSYSYIFYLFIYLGVWELVTLNSISTYKPLMLFVLSIWHVLLSYSKGRKTRTKKQLSDLLFFFVSGNYYFSTGDIHSSNHVPIYNVQCYILLDVIFIKLLLKQLEHAIKTITIVAMLIIIIDLIYRTFEKYKSYNHGANKNMFTRHQCGHCITKSDLVCQICGRYSSSL